MCSLFTFFFQPRISLSGSASLTPRKTTVAFLPNPFSRDRALQSVVTPDATTMERILNLFQLDGYVMERDGQAIDTQGPGKEGGGDSRGLDLLVFNQWQQACSRLNVSHVHVVCFTSPLTIMFFHFFDERIDTLLLYQVNRAAPKSGAHHPGSKHSADGRGAFYQKIEIGAAHLVSVP